MINYDEEPGVDVKLMPSGSILTVNKTKLTHNGNYTCAPSNAKAASVMVHVIEGERNVASFLSLIPVEFNSGFDVIENNLLTQN